MYTLNVLKRSPGVAISYDIDTKISYREFGGSPRRLRGRTKVTQRQGAIFERSTYGRYEFKNCGYNLQCE